MLDTAIILNGPPGVGKDTLANLLVRSFAIPTMAFKEVLYRETARYFSVELNTFIRMASGRKSKEVVSPMLRLQLPWRKKHEVKYRYLTPRQALIFVSELVIKPREGVRYFGDAAVALCVERDYKWVVFSDGGFPEETESISEAFQQTFLFHLHRDPCTFEGDSRDYVRGFANTHTLNLIDGDPEEAVNTIGSIIRTTSRNWKGAPSYDTNIGNT